MEFAKKQSFRLWDLVSPVKLIQKFFILSLLSSGRRRGSFLILRGFLLKSPEELKGRW